MVGYSTCAHHTILESLVFFLELNTCTFKLKWWTSFYVRRRSGKPPSRQTVQKRRFNIKTPWHWSHRHWYVDSHGNSSHRCLQFRYRVTSKVINTKGYPFSEVTWRKLKLTMNYGKTANQLKTDMLVPVARRGRGSIALERSLRLANFNIVRGSLLKFRHYLESILGIWRNVLDYSSLYPADGKVLSNREPPV